MSINEKMTAIANDTRGLTGSTGALTLNGIHSKLSNAQTETDTQAELIAQITNALAGKGTIESSSLQQKIVTPTTSQQIVAPDSGYQGLSRVTVNAIPASLLGGAVDVVVAANESSLPTSAENGTIVIISNPIFTVGNVSVQNIQPTTAVKNDIWITVSETSAAPIKKGVITFYPTAVKRHNGSTWESTTAFVKYDEEWISMDLMLFKTGNGFNITTGGWRLYGSQSDMSLGMSFDNITSNTDIIVNVTKDYRPTAAVSLAFGTVNKIAAGRYNQLAVTFKNEYISQIYVGFSETLASDYAVNFDLQTNIGGARHTSWTTSYLDLSSLGSSYSGYFYVKIQAVANRTSEDKITISDIRLTN